MKRVATVKKAAVVLKTVSVVLAAALLLRATVSAAELRVMTSGAFTAAYLDLFPHFAETSGDTFSTATTSSGVGADSISSRLARGESVDVVIMARDAMDELVRQGRVVPDSCVDLARSAIGMAVRAGAAKPDITSVDALRRTLLQASSIAYSSSVSGQYLSRELFQRLGIADEVLPKSRRIEQERVGSVIARGDVELGFQQISELLPVPGITYIGPLPLEVQRVTIFSAGVPATSKSPEAARAFIRFLASPQAAGSVARSGMEPRHSSSDVRPEYTPLARTGPFLKSEPVTALGAQARTLVALTGQVVSSQEGPMEGVLVSAKRTGSTITTTVVTDRDGRYRFPESRLEPGDYAIHVRAAGYELDQPASASVTARNLVTLNLKLRKSHDLAAQLTNADWFASFPGTVTQKASIRGCTHCHTVERIVRTRYDVDKLMSVIERMSTYPQLSFPLKVQKLPAPRIGGGTESPEQRRALWRRQAEYLATLNLSAGPEWSYPLKTQPRPTGRATEVIYTEYDLPARTRQPHDVIVDSKGLAWYASFGEQILGVLDPKTGKAVEYPIPTLKASAPTGTLGVRFDRDENPWLGMQFQGGIAKFDRHSETFQTWSLPPELNGPHVQINQVSPDRSYVDGKVWLQDAGTYTVLRLDVASGQFDVFEPYKIPRPNVYDVIPDSRNNGYFLVLGSQDVGRVDARTGEIRIFKTPTPQSGPRRGMMDSQDRLWFGENNGDRIGMFDTRTERFQEWQVPTPGAWPYDVTADKDGNVWSGGEYNDRILRLDPTSGAFVEYLLPRSTNVRRVFVDNRTTPVTFWVGSNHGASIVKLEPMDRPSSKTSSSQR